MVKEELFILSNKNIQRVKKAFESTFNSVCNIYEYEKVILPNKSTSLKERLIYHDVPCKLSFKNNEKTISKDNGNLLKGDVKIFLPSNINVKSGSKIIVEYLGETFTYKNSSKSINFNTHQEVIATSFDEWA